MKTLPIQVKVSPEEMVKIDEFATKLSISRGTVLRIALQLLIKNPRLITEILDEGDHVQGV